MAAVPRRWLLAATAALGGCSVLPQPAYVQRTVWPLDVRRRVVLPPRRRGTVLVVRDLTAAPGLEQRGVQWLRPDGSLHVDYYNQWAVPPAEGVTDDLRRWLADSGLFAAVVGPDSGLAGDFVLEGELTAFLGDPARKQARVALALVLIGRSGGAGAGADAADGGGGGADRRRGAIGSGGGAAGGAAGCAGPDRDGGAPRGDSLTRAGARPGEAQPNQDRPRWNTIRRLDHPV